MMNIRCFLLTALLTLAVGNAVADELTIGDFSIAPGETKTISIELSNPTNDYIAFECWLRLPDGVRIVYDEEGFLSAVLNSTRAPRHELEVKEPEGDGVYHLLCYSSRNSTIKERSGELISLTVQCSADAAAGNFDGLLYDLIFSDPGKVQVNFSDAPFTVTVSPSLQRGDADGSGEVTMADALAVVRHVLGLQPTPFFDDAADANGADGITIADAAAIVDIILGRSSGD